MARTWDGYVVFCGGPNGCLSENIKKLDDENHHIEDYEYFECLDCGKKIKIELPN